MVDWKKAGFFVFLAYFWTYKIKKSKILIWGLWPTVEGGGGGAGVKPLSTKCEEEEKIFTPPEGA